MNCGLLITDFDLSSSQDLLLPRSLVSRLARGVLPANTSIQKDATLALAKSATVFISYLTHHANEQTSKKTIGPQDVIKALSEIEMSGVMGLGAGGAGKDGPRLGARLEKELEAYEEIVRGKRKGYRDKVKARESLGDGGQEEEEDRGEPTNKKVRRMSEEGQGQGDGEDAEDEERMLEAQLNGAGMDEDEEVDGEGKARGKGKSTDEMMFVNGKEDVEEGDGDGEDEGDDEHDDDQEEEEDEDEDEEQDEEEDDENENNADGADADEMDERPDRDGRGSISLMPDGNVEMRSDDESD
jgi:histone H3/H4